MVTLIDRKALWWCIVVMALVGCAHAPKPERRIYVISEDARGVGAALATGGAGDRDCQAEHEECFRRCWQKSRPPYPHKHDEWYYKRCTEDCMKAYNDCLDEQEEEARNSARKLDFMTADQAIEWLTLHKAEVALGTVVVIAGVAFILTTGGAGALVLVPLAL